MEGYVYRPNRSNTHRITVILQAAEELRAQANNMTRPDDFELPRWRFKNERLYIQRNAGKEGANG